MTDWAKAMNPTSPLNTEAEALAAARASAIAIFLGALWGLVGVIYLMTAGQEAMAAAFAQGAADAPEMAGMAGTMSQVALWTAGFFVVLQLILGFVQWKKPNKVLPILFIILVVYGIGSAALGQMMAGQLDIPEAAQGPLWLTLIGYVVMVIQLVMHIAGVRGASKLDKIRMDAAQSY
jgi:preprotein translocase subunit SecG